MVGGLNFRAGDVPRSSEMVLIGDSPDSFHAAKVDEHWEDTEMVHQAGSQIRRRPIRARVFAIADAIDWLGPLPLGDTDSIVEFWSVATKLGLDLVSRAQVQPAITASGFDAWHVTPVTSDDTERLEQLAAAMPVECYSLPSGTEPLRLHAPVAIIRNYWDAIADALVRTPGAAQTVRSTTFASKERAAIGQMREWLAGTTANSASSVRLGFRLEPPETRDSFALVPYLQSTADHSLAIDAVHIWDAEPAVMQKLGANVEETLLLALRRAGQVWAPLGGILNQARPDHLNLNDAEVDEFLGTASESLRTNGFEISWPTEFTSTALEVRATITTARPTSAKESSFGLGDAVELKWNATMAGETISDEELAQLANAKRPLISLRGRWVVVDQVTLDRIRKRKNKKPQTLTAGRALAAAMTGELTVDGEVMKVEVDSTLSSVVNRLATYTPETDMAEPEGLMATLRPYQRRGLAWLNEMCDLGLGGCLADDMGLGKTIQVIALHLHRKGGPMLVVCPTSLLGNWEREIAKFAPSINVKRFHGSSRSLGDVGPTDIALVTYGVVRRDRETLNEVPWDIVVADEAQHAKNPLSQTARSLRAIHCNVRLALTGTPVENQLSELWSLLDWTTPGLLGSLEGFRRNVATPIERFHDDDAIAALSKVVRPFLLRRRKVDPDVAPELPPKTESDLYVSLTLEQASLYKAVTDQALETIKTKSGMERRGLILKLLTALKQICNHPAQYLKQPGPLDGRSAKLAALDELLEGLDGTDESVLVFSQYVQMGNLLETHLASRGRSSLFLHGSIPPRRRDEMVEDFQAGKSNVFLLSLKAGGTGLNLTRATHVVHFDRWWNPAVEDQATDRAYRIGQTQPVQVHRLICQGTLEERIAVMLSEKRNLSEAVIGSGENWISELGDAELAALVAFEDMS